MVESHLDIRKKHSTTSLLLSLFSWSFQLCASTMFTVIETYKAYGVHGLLFKWFCSFLADGLLLLAMYLVS